MIRSPLWSDIFACPQEGILLQVELRCKYAMYSIRQSLLYVNILTLIVIFFAAASFFSCSTMNDSYLSHTFGPSSGPVKSSLSFIRFGVIRHSFPISAFSMLQNGRTGRRVYIFSQVVGR